MADAAFSQLLAMKREEDEQAGKWLRTHSRIRRQNKLRSNVAVDHRAVHYYGIAGARTEWRTQAPKIPASSPMRKRPPAYPVWEHPRHVNNRGLPAYTALGDQHCSGFFSSPIPPVYSAGETLERPEPSEGTTASRPQSAASRPRSAKSRGMYMETRSVNSLANGFGASLTRDGLRIVGEATERSLMSDESLRALYEPLMRLPAGELGAPHSPHSSGSPPRTPPKLSPASGALGLYEEAKTRALARPASATPYGRAATISAQPLTRSHLDSPRSIRSSITDKTIGHAPRHLAALNQLSLR